ncbi:BON domain-containing protein [Burkholderia sp. HI2500]|uniref:BON domain-containing protein n=1 Tax=Burkholderia sp. HI2500 TaxID=2015358 RepID=UPI000B7A26C6|nr:BON domain-containing protein [Burkholderia sp. HI2500]OXJ07008.1 hypothetical protein CFB45_32835 [Burkholderia sp. HI2500]
MAPAHRQRKPSRARAESDERSAYPSYRPLRPRLVARPRDVEVRVERGRVCLTGQIEESERQAVVDGVAALHGVHGVEDALGTRSEYKAPTDGHSS